MKVLPLLSWLLGLVTPLFWEQLPAAGTLVWLMLSALILVGLGQCRVAVFLVGLCYTSLVGQSLTRLPLFAKDHSIEAVVLADSAAQYVHITALDGKAISPLLARLGWYLDSPRAKPGQTLVAKVRLRGVHQRRNPGSRAAARRDAAQGLAALGYVEAVGAIQGLPDWRGRWHQYLAGRLAPYPQGGLMLALLSGERGQLDPATRQLLAGSGTAHLLAISGLHVALVAAIGLWLGHLLPGNGRRWGLWLGLVLAGLYAWQAGLGPPTLRALTALIAWVLWLGWRRPLQAGRLWLSLLCLFATLNPLVLLDSRLWLSFCAVGLILLLLWRFPVRGWRLLLVLQGGLVLLMWPLQWWLFGAVPAWSLLANLVAVPLVTLVVMPALLAGLLLPGPWWLADKGLGALLWLLGLLQGSLPGQWLWLLVLLPLAFLPLGRASRLALGAAALLFVALLPPAEDGVWFLDVGQGSSTALVAGRQMLLVDTGPGLWAMDGARSLAASRHLDTLVLSHSDRDHVGGAAAFDAPILAGQPAVGQRQCLAGQTLALAGGELHVLWPPRPGLRPDNDASCILAGRLAGHSFLLPGDASARVEASRSWPQADWLAVPHHGSKSASSQAFIDQVRPKVAVFSTGLGNPFGFPVPAVVARYRAEGAATWNTASQGALFCAKSGCQGLRHYWWEGAVVGLEGR
ncbi:DNA internalization-related competence protein ComEC/Rec2 [Gallaecimonas kandeliae]|uniref:DNA internalization-related competence protein ComEC/Rec2 n=1 Tax=Gallaecimonas kandeliae TaxID=3029055 RepID=UPI00264782C0|nr:DNA internalization-related competence protein ComEC/Rec2 [Gallaecimonas kandeliae]WKE67047.1 DNA internalization-related competence protein ComEC/Rec2 [Gallaecimonas kandeliae]